MTRAVSPLSSTASNLDRLADPKAIQQIIYDWFELLHSIGPSMHRATFLRRLANGDALHNVEFSNLVISTCAATVAGLRRKTVPYQQYVTVDRCMELIATTDSGMPNSQFTFEWCQTKYNLAMAYYAEKGIGCHESFHLMSEASAGVRHLIFCASPQPSFMNQQLLKRLYWLIFAAQW